jgi:hypothetical protein
VDLRISMASSCRCSSISSVTERAEALLRVAQGPANQHFSL